MASSKVLKSFIQATGLPPEVVSREIRRLALEQGKDETQLSLEELRDLLTDYLQDVLLATMEDQQA